MRFLLLNIFLLLFASISSQAQWSATGGPDDYGYTWRTYEADNGPTYDWVDITQLGTLVDGLADDNSVGPFNMGFVFPYYWVGRSEVYIGSNGYISFEPGTIASSQIGFPPTPSADKPDDVIAPFLVDLNPAGGGNPGEVYYYSDIENQRFIVSYIDMPFFNNQASQGYAGSNTFQVILDAKDSTITFQYQNQQGNWDPAYENTQFPMVVGIENLTGTLGLSVSTSQKPLANTAIRFYMPAVPGLDIVDAAPVNIQNSDNGAFFIPFSDGEESSIPLTAVIASVGNADINSPITAVAQVRNPNGDLIYQRSETISDLEGGERREVIFNRPFIAEETGSHTMTVSTILDGDANNSNNSFSTELRVVDSTEQKVLLGYASDRRSNLIGPSGGFTQSADIAGLGIGIGESGVGVFFDSYAYPVLVEALEFNAVVLATGSAPETGFIAEIYQASPDFPVPGILVYRDSIGLDELRLDVNYSRITLDQPVAITEPGFYVAFIQLNNSVVLLEENISPISRRSYEILNYSWAPYRENNSKELWIRAEVDTRFSNLTTSNKTRLEAREISLFPNPASDQVSFHLKLGQAHPLKVSLTDLQGRLVDEFEFGPGYLHRHEINLADIAKGTYILTFEAQGYRASQKLQIQ